MGELDTSVANTLTSILASIGNNSTSFYTAARDLVEKFESGLKVNSSTISNNLIQPVTSALSTIRGYYGSFYSTGSYLVSGFVAGIRNNIARAAAAAAAMAAAASSAARANLDEHSPSKVFEQIGRFVPEGFANGVYKAGHYVDESISAMSKDAIDGTNKSISEIANALDNDLDSKPTIRPVVDLSDIKNGADTIKGLLNINPSVGILSNVKAINDAMGRNNQNAGNIEVVAAINKLRNDLGKIGGSSRNTYNINGVTYDDGSNVAVAIQEIIRAIKLEGRM